MVKALGYIRVSTDIQVEEGSSLITQREEIATYCRDHSIDLVTVYEDAGISGAKLFERAGLMELIDRLEREHIDFLLVSKMDRLSRDAEARGWINFEMQRRGIKTKVLSLVASENMEGKDGFTKMMNAMIAYIAEIERERITQRLSAGRTHKRKQGGFAGGRAPLGYISEKGSKRLHVNADKVETVRRLFALREEGGTLQAVADRLNHEGYTTQNDKRFTQMQVKRALEREDLYRGKLDADPIL
ncbi:recombinase family protein [Rossellomorea marisflavi]|uniref:recombinase family protein n=1 Tax=Rossellomorea marisflavi TaxID=189381 RepID=UPI0028534A20|nr:recombinase family protein [Rossellomorea marisflavi]MDR4936054.1 recombinase family protein [Rossellomorea marisflavi]